MDDPVDSGLAPQVVVRIGAARIGIPADNVLRALSAPEQFVPLPRRHGALLGMLAVDGQPVPVIDIACWVALAADAGAAAGVDANADSLASADAADGAHSGRKSVIAGMGRVVLLRAGERMAAVRVDALEPMAALPASAVVRLCHDDDPDQLFHSAAMLPDGGAMLALLNVDSLFNLSHSWCSTAGVGIPATESEAAPAIAEEDTATWAILQANGERLAIRADHVAEVLPMPEHERFMGTSGVSLCRWREGHLAIVPLARLLGRSSAANPPLLAVLRLGEHALGLPIEQVCELRQLPATPQGISTETPGRLPCLTVSDDDGATLRMVDTDALFAMHPESALNLEDRNETAINAARRNEETYVVLEAGGKLALPIGALEEVLHAEPEDCVPTPSGDATLNWRGTTISVRDARQASERKGKVPLVVLRTEGSPIALAVDSIVSMITPGSAQLSRMQRAGKMVELLILDEEEGSSTYRVADANALLTLNADKSAARLSLQ